MGRTLQVRVSAQTFDPSEISRRWPHLAALAFSPVAVKIPALPEDRRGVVELVENLADRLRIGMLPEEAARTLAEGIRRVAAERERLGAHLAEWDAREANRDTERLEDGLDDLEDQARGLKNPPGRDE